MKIALIQCNVADGNLEANASKLAAGCRKAANSGASLCIAPMEALCGPNAEYFARQEDFIQCRRQMVAALAAELENGPALLCGYSGMGGGCLLVANGDYIATDSIFYFGGHRFGIARSKSQNDSSDMKCLDFSIDLGAWPFAPGGQGRLEKREKEIAGGQSIWRVSVNLVGGYENLVYSGQSLAFDPQGRLRARGKAFEEDIIVFETEGGPESLAIAPACASAEEEQWRALILGLGDFTRKAGAKTALLGLSGGMDSALVACLGAEALGPENVTGIIMPSPYTSPASISDARELAGNLGISALVLSIDDLLGEYERALAPVLEKFPAAPQDLTFENLQARIRGVLLMAAANRSGSLVLNTGNKSELAMGYCTLYGDAVGAVAVLGDIFKTRVYELAAWFCKERGKMIIPRNIFDKAPSAELRPDQKDTDSLPPYGELDPILKRILAGEDYSGQDRKKFEEIRQQVFRNRFKARQSPPPLLVGGGTFSCHI